MPGRGRVGSAFLKSGPAPALCARLDRGNCLYVGMSTLFEKIIAREIPAKIEHEDDLCIVIHDIDPQAPTHLLVIPKQVVPRIGEATEAEQSLLGHLLLTAAKVAQSLHLSGGYRVVVNNGPDGGETVPHLHVHVLGGRALTWPPG